MRTFKIIFVAACAVALVFFTVTLMSSRYLAFMHRDAAYFSDVAHACDAIRLQHPPGSNDSVTLYGKMTLSCTLKVSGRDPSLPMIIRALHPDHILVSTNRVFIDIPPERAGGFAVIWQLDENQPDRWTLQTSGDGLVKTVYEERKRW